MDKSLSKNFESWLKRVAKAWGQPVEQTGREIGIIEIDNRKQHYPAVQKSLLARPFKLSDFRSASKDCWAISGQNEAIRFNNFAKSKSANSVISKLIKSFPKKNADAVRRIDGFVNAATKHGFSTPSGSSDWAGAGLLASFILTALSPKRFVDFRQNRWADLAEELKYHSPFPQHASYGELLVWAGTFAKSLSRTDAFQSMVQTHWQGVEPLWVVSGICWPGTNPKHLGADPIDREEIDSFPEGGEKRHLHLMRERNRTVVNKAKEQRKKVDPKLHCEVCEFSYVEIYGDLGEGFIEAHHTLPIAKLKKGHKTKVEDIALVCANCHRMIHRGDHSLALDELREKLLRVTAT